MEHELGEPMYSTLDPSRTEKKPWRFLGESQLSVLTNFTPGLLLFIIAAIIDGAVHPYERDVADYSDGPTISHPKLPQTVTATQLYIYSWLLPPFLIALICAARREWRLLHTSILGFVECAAINLFVTNFIKKSAGSLRPNFYAYCGWNGTQCNGPEAYVISARQSFPSGHASIAGAAMAYFSLFLIYTIEQSTKQVRQSAVSSSARIGAIFPVVFAIWIAITRTIDYYHRFEVPASTLVS